MSSAAIVSDPGPLPATLVAGFVIGLIYFGMLWRTAKVSDSSHGWFELAVLTLGRISGAGIFLASEAKLGAGPLLAALLGFLLARRAILRAVRRSS
jgi:F1F0 ATPase subunit 2